jgi:hypothetical protein
VGQNVFHPGQVFQGLRCARPPRFARGSSQRCSSPTLGNPNTAPLRQRTSPNASVPRRWDSHQLASLAIGIFGKSLEKCGDPVGMKYPVCNDLTLSCLPPCLLAAFNGAVCFVGTCGACAMERREATNLSCTMRGRDLGSTR